MVTTNLQGSLLCTRAALRAMARQPRGGHVFNMDGAGADGMATPQYAAYGATKAGAGARGRPGPAVVSRLVRYVFHDFHARYGNAYLLVGRQAAVRLLLGVHERSILVVVPVNRITCGGRVGSRCPAGQPASVVQLLVGVHERSTLVVVPVNRITCGGRVGSRCTAGQPASVVRLLMGVDERSTLVVVPVNRITCGGRGGSRCPAGQPASVRWPCAAQAGQPETRRRSRRTRRRACA